MVRLLTKYSPTQLLAWADSKPHNPAFLLKILHGLLRILLITFSEFKKNDLSLRASALTYTILLSLVPMLAMSTAVVKGLGGGDQLRKAAYSYVDTLDRKNTPASPNYEIPPQDSQEPTSAPPSSTLTGHLKSALDKLFDYVDKTNFATLGTFGVLGMVLSVVLVFGNIEMAMNTIWNVESGRSVMRKIADYLALVVLMPISLNVGFAAGAIVTSEALLSKVAIFLPILWVQALILKLIPIFFLSLTLFVIYLFFPNTKVKTLPALTGALIAGFFWFEAQNIYIGLQIGVAKHNAIYGSFATLPLFLVWMYFGWVFILIGAQIAYSCQHRDSYQLLPTPTVPSLQLSAAFDIVSYVFTSFENAQPTSPEELHKHYSGYQSSLLYKTTELLISAGILHTMEETGHLMPSSPMEKAGHDKIIQAILGSSMTETEGGRESSLAIQAAGKAHYISSEK